jgi:hypothetical protein
MSKRQEQNMGTKEQGVGRSKIWQMAMGEQKSGKGVGAGSGSRSEGGSRG